MQKVHQGHDIISLFELIMKSKREGVGSSIIRDRQRLMLSVITAFFIVIAAAYILNIFNQGLEQRLILTSGTEKTAFQPGKFISQSISQGYIGK